MTTSDPRRSPPGTESAWAYTHVPQQIRGDAGGDGISDAWDDTSTKAFVDRMERRIEQLAPGFQSLIKARHVKDRKRVGKGKSVYVRGDRGGRRTNKKKK